jgi:hypothetical protein
MGGRAERWRLPVTRRRKITLGAAVAAVIVAAAAYTLNHDGALGPAASLPAAPLSAGPVTDTLVDAGLAQQDGSTFTVDVDATRILVDSIATPLGPEPTAADYERGAFGPAWSDIDRNGCDQRNDVLARDLAEVVFKPGTHNCVALHGELFDPYTGSRITFTRGEGTSEAVQIDHLVPLSWAWRHGANDWDADTRRAFANDFLNLQATDGPTNAAKSDKGPAAWLPPDPGYRCAYVTRFSLVVATYGLTLDDPDRQMVAGVLDSCQPHVEPQ